MPLFSIASVTTRRRISMAAPSLHMLSGKFIVFDGPDGCGKTTQLRTLMSRLQEAGMKVRRLREPGGTPIGEQIRDLLLSTKTQNMDVGCEMLLYMASRAQLVYEEIRPALAAGECVVSDRYASSTLAYQGGGGGMSLDAILDVAKVAVGTTWPHLTVIFDLDTDEAMARINPLYSSKAATGGAVGGPNRRRADQNQTALFSDADLKDRIEQRARDYFERVRENYRWQAAQWPDRYRTVDASKSIRDVEKQVMRTLLDFFPASGG
jgi:dTMP kinase